MYIFLLGMGQFLQYNGVCLSPYSVFYALRSSISLIYNFKRSSELSFETLKKINCQCEIELLQSLRLHQTKKFTQLKKSIRLLHMLCHQCSNSKKQLNEVWCKLLYQISVQGIMIKKKPNKYRQYVVDISIYTPDSMVNTSCFNACYLSI